MHHKINSLTTENTYYSKEKDNIPIKTIYSNKSYLNTLKEQNNNIKLRNKNPTFNISYSNQMFKPKKSIISFKNINNNFYS